MATAGAEPGERRLRIGAVLDLLRPDFPGVTISKIRFLEAEGLVQPDRTAAGYRVFSDADVERLRFVLTAQRDRFWPLRVIREALDARDRGLDVPGAPADGAASTSAPSVPTVPDMGDDADVPSTRDLAADAPQLRLTRAELLRASGLEASMLDDLCTHGLIGPDGSGHYDARALQIADAAAGLAAFGLEARHLRPFRTAADREIGLVSQITAPARRRSDEAGRALAAEVLHHCIALHTALVKSGL